MITLYKQDGEILYGIKEFLLDSTEDIKDLPRNIRIGSSALIISTGEKYYLNGSKQWQLLGTVNNPSSCDCEDVLNQIDADGNNIVDTVELNEF